MSGEIVALLSAAPPFLFVLHLFQIALILLVLRYLDIYEREPYAVILVMFAWGALGAVLLSFIGNELVMAALAPDVAAVFGPAISAPLVEEIAKGVALVAALFACNAAANRYGTPRFQGLVDGLVYGAAVGLGFAFTENILYFFQFLAEGDLPAAIEVFLLRVDFTGFGVLGHAVYSGLFGAGLGLATWTASRLRGVGAAALGLAAGMALHAAWNGLPMLVVVNEFGFDVVAAAMFGEIAPGVSVEALSAAVDRGVELAQRVHYVSILAIAAAFALWLRTERRIMRSELAEEVDAGLLSAGELEVLPMFWGRIELYRRLLREHGADHARAASQRHDALVRLALRKWRADRIGGDAADVEELRLRVRASAAYLHALGTDTDDLVAPTSPSSG